MKNRTVKSFAVLILVSSVLISGCGSHIPEMTEEQTALVTEYAANLLIKYNSLSNRKLLNNSQLKQEEEKEAQEAEKQKKKEEAAQAYMAAKQNKEEGTQSDGSNSAEQTAAGQENISDLAAFYGMDGFTVAYDSYELCTSYPDETREDYFLAMDATPGKQLCIIKFQVTNTAASDQDFDMFQNQAVFYLSIDQGEKTQVQSTLLLDDLGSYKGIIAAGASEQMVLVFEIPDTITQIGTMELTARFGDQRGIMLLQ